MSPKTVGETPEAVSLLRAASKLIPDQPGPELGDLHLGYLIDLWIEMTEHFAPLRQLGDIFMALIRRHGHGGGPVVSLMIPRNFRCYNDDDDDDGDDDDDDDDAGDAVDDADGADDDAADDDDDDD